MKILRISLLVLIVIGVLLLLTQKLWVPKLTNWILQSESTDVNKQTPFKPAEKSPARISISTQEIEEENLIGRMSIISSSSLIAVKSREYIESTVAEFRKEANIEVPKLRKEWGPDRPNAFYEIDIDAEYVAGDKTESIVMSEYTYTGGAHGSSMYKVITANISDGKILPLSDMVKKEKQNAFTEFVKKQLNDWRPEGSDASPVFPDEVKDLTFNSFANWSLDDKNLIIYFDQYAIGPGVLGATAFPLPLPKIRDFLRSFD